MVKRGTGGGARFSSPENLRMMMETLLNLNKLLRPDTADPSNDLPDAAPQERKVREVVRL